MRLIDADLVIERLGHDMQEMDDPIFIMMVAATISDIRHAPTIDTVIPVQFITDKINGLEYLQKKMAAWITPELEIQIQTLVNLIYDYAQIARSKEE